MNFPRPEKSGDAHPEGYAQVQREETPTSSLQTCSIRDKAEQKSSIAWPTSRAAEEGALRRVGCVAQQEGEKIFERAPYVSMVAGSLHTIMPAMLVQISRATRVTGP